MVPIHKRKQVSDSFERLDRLWDSHPQYREMGTFATLGELLEEHESYRDGFEELMEEYESNHYERFLIQLSWSDLPYRYATKEMIESADLPEENAYAAAFMEQFNGIDTDRKACFLFPESFVSSYFVIREVCKTRRQFDR